MDREGLKALGVADEHVDAILDKFHKEQGDYQSQVETLTSERDNARAEVKKYEKGGEKYVDVAEFAALKQFKTDVETKEVKAGKDKAFDALLSKLKVNPDMHGLVKQLLDYDALTLTDKGECTEEYEKEFAEKLKAVCPTAFVTPPAGTGINYGDKGQAGAGGKATDNSTAEWKAAIDAKLKK